MDEMPCVAVVGPQKNRRDLIVFLVEANFKVKAIEASKTEEARELIGAFKENLKLILLDHDRDFCKAEEILKNLKKEKWNIPVVITNHDHPERIPGLEKFALIGVSAQQVVLPLIEKIELYLAPLKNYEGNFCKVSLKTLSAFSHLGEDLFFKVNRDRFVKLFHFNDRMDGEDFKRYGRRGLGHLYILKTRNNHIQLTLDKCIDEIEKKNLSLSQIEIDKRTMQNMIPFYEEPLELRRNLVRTLNLSSLKAKEKILNNAFLHPYHEELLSKESGVQLSWQYMGYLTNASIVIAENMQWLNEPIVEKFVYLGFVLGILYNHSIAGEKPKNIFAYTLSRQDHCNNPQDSMVKLMARFSKEVAKDPQTPLEVELILGQLSDLYSGEYQKSHQYKFLPTTLVLIIAHELVDYLISSPYHHETPDLEIFMKMQREKYSIPQIDKIIDSFSVYLD